MPEAIFSPANVLQKNSDESALWILCSDCNVSKFRKLKTKNESLECYSYCHSYNEKGREDRDLNRRLTIGRRIMQW